MMRVTLYGTRGSLPAPGPATARYGGNTSAVEIISDDGTMLVLDAGTGIRGLGQKVPKDTARIDILLTHLHMDHIQGLPSVLLQPAISSRNRRAHLGTCQQHAFARRTSFSLSLTASIPCPLSRFTIRRLPRDSDGGIRHRSVQD